MLAGEKFMVSGPPAESGHRPGTVYETYVIHYLEEMWVNEDSSHTTPGKCGYRYEGLYEIDFLFV